jgi:hypothetical protein
MPEAPENKVPKTYSFSPINIRWLKDRAAADTLAAGRTISSSAILDGLVSAAREDDARAGRILKSIRRAAAAEGMK